MLAIDQTEFVRYCRHVLDMVDNSTTQGLYMSTVSTFLNWHRHAKAGLSPLTTKSLIPERDRPDSDDRDAFTLDQLRPVSENAKKYRESCPHKFWVSIAPAFLGCRIEELCQVHLATGLAQDSEANVRYLILNERPDEDGVIRKSIKKVSGYRKVPMHSALACHGFLDFLSAQTKAGCLRPFQQEWKPREVESEPGPIVKWSHYVSRWGGRELKAIAQRHSFDQSRP